MPQNSTPIFVLTPSFSKTVINAANVTTNGTGIIGFNIFLAFSSGANGSRVDSITFTNESSSGTNTSSATRISCYFSTVSSGTTTSADTFIFAEAPMPSSTARSSTTIGATYTFSFPGGILVPSGTNILVTSSVYSTLAPLVDNISVLTKGGNY